MFFVILLLVLSITVVGFSLYIGITPMPSSSQAKKAIAHYIKDCHGIIYELGSGWGGLAFSLSKKSPSSSIIAFEISPLPWAVSTVMQKIKGASNITFCLENFFQTPLDQADIVVCYLYPGAMQKLKKKFEQELKPGSLVISNTFRVPGWIPHQAITINNFWQTPIFIYRV